MSDESVEDNGWILIEYAIIIAIFFFLALLSSSLIKFQMSFEVPIIPFTVQHFLAYWRWSSKHLTCIIFLKIMDSISIYIWQRFYFKQKFKRFKKTKENRFQYSVSVHCKNNVSYYKKKQRFSWFTVHTMWHQANYCE